MCDGTACCLRHLRWSSVRSPPHRASFVTAPPVPRTELPPLPSGVVPPAGSERGWLIASGCAAPRDCGRNAQQSPDVHPASAAHGHHSFEPAERPAPDGNVATSPGARAVLFTAFACTNKRCREVARDQLPRSRIPDPLRRFPTGKGCSRRWSRTRSASYESACRCGLPAIGGTPFISSRASPLSNTITVWPSIASPTTFARSRASRKRRGRFAASTRVCSISSFPFRTRAGFVASSWRGPSLRRVPPARLSCSDGSR